MARITDFFVRIYRRVLVHHARHLSAQLMFYLLLIGLLPVFIAGYVVNAQFESNLLAQTEQDLKHRLGEMNDGIETYFRTQEKNLRTFASTPTLQKIMQESIAAYVQDGADGLALQEVEDKYADFLSAYAENNFYTDIYLVSKDGDVLISLLHGTGHGVNLQQAGWGERSMGAVFKQSMSVLQVLTSYPEVDEEHGVYVYVASPVQVNDEIIGSVMLKVNMKNIQIFYLDSLQLTDDIHMIVAQNVAGKWQRVYLSGLSDEKTLSPWEINNLQQHILHMNHMLKNQNYYEVSSYLPTFAAFVVLGVPQAYVMADVQRSRWLVLLFMLVSALVIVLLASRLASNFIRPIRELGRSFQALGHGETRVSVAIERQDEIGLLARQFNEMADNLQKTKSQLVQSEKLASIGHLAAGVAHEINNPMGIVTANVSTLDEYVRQLIACVECLNTADVSAQQELVARMQALYRQQDLKFVCEDTGSLLQETNQNLSRVRDIVSSMQVFAEIDKEDVVACDLVALMDSCLAEITTQITGHINLLREYDGAEPVQGRPKQLKRAFLHVLDNALKAVVQKEHGIIRVRIQHQEGMAVISIDDNGVGISPDNKDKIFNPFFTTRAVGQGLGMGLSVTYSIITAHGGDISAASREGKGTRICIRLPSGVDVVASNT